MNKSYHCRQTIHWSGMGTNPSSSAWSIIEHSNGDSTCISNISILLYARITCKKLSSICTTHLHTHPFNGPLSGTTRVSWYQKGKTNLDFTEARDSEWQWHPLGHMQVCTSLQTDNHASSPPLSCLQAGCPSCCPTNSVKALKARSICTTINCKCPERNHN